MSIESELDKIGKNIVKDAKANVAKNKDTGSLQASIRYKTNFIDDDKFNIVIEENDYGKFLNAKTHYMDKAIEKNIKNNELDSIVNIITDDMLKNFK